MSVSDVPQHESPLWCTVRRAKPLWFIYIAGTGALAVVRFCAADVLGCITALLLVLLTVIMVRDGMRLMKLMVMLFWILSLIAFAFDFMLLIGNLQGRQLATTHIISTQKNATEVSTYFTQKTETAPLFDNDRGWLYNMESLSLLAAPVIGLFGTVLGVWTQSVLDGEVSPQTADLLFFEDSALGQPLLARDVVPAYHPPPSPEDLEQLRQACNPGPLRSQHFSYTFQGRAFKLTSDEP